MVTWVKIKATLTSSSSSIRIVSSTTSMKAFILMSLFSISPSTRTAETPRTKSTCCTSHTTLTRLCPTASKSLISLKSRRTGALAASTLSLSGRKWSRSLKDWVRETAHVLVCRSGYSKRTISISLSWLWSVTSMTWVYACCHEGPPPKPTPPPLALHFHCSPPMSLPVQPPHPPLAASIVVCPCPFCFFLPMLEEGWRSRTAKEMDGCGTDRRGSSNGMGRTAVADRGRSWPGQQATVCPAVHLFLVYLV